MACLRWVVAGVAGALARMLALCRCFLAYASGYYDALRVACECVFGLLLRCSCGAGLLRNVALPVKRNRMCINPAQPA